MPHDAGDFKESWKSIGTLPPGAITAVAAGQDPGICLLAGAPTGIYRALGSSSIDHLAWERLVNGPGGILALACSPAFEHDHTFIAGTEHGVWISNDRGESWRRAHIPLARTMVLTVAFSPDYAMDGIVLAGTLEDGVLYSNNRGENWTTRNFGLLDSCVYALGFSPGFGRDGRVYAGTATGLYYSYNHARAWKSLPFAGEESPVYSLTVLPPSDSNIESIIFAGTEDQGLFKSHNLGQDWVPSGLGVRMINGLVACPEGRYVLAATEKGIYQSSAVGDSWELVLEHRDTTCVAASNAYVFAGTAEDGLWVADTSELPRQLTDLVTRPVTGLLVTDHFQTDGLAWLFGPGEGLWRSRDGGTFWESLVDDLQQADVYALAIGQSGENGWLAAATAGGVVFSDDRGDHWRDTNELELSGKMADVVACAPDGSRYLASYPGHGLYETRDRGRSWGRVKTGWGEGASIVALKIDPAGVCCAALLDASGSTVEVWLEMGGNFEKVLAQPAAANIVISLIPLADEAGTAWYIAFGDTVWKLAGSICGSMAISQFYRAEQPEQNLLSLAGKNGEGGTALLVSTGRTIIEAREGGWWRQVCNLGQERALQIAWPPGKLGSRRAYALLLGGIFCQIDLPD